MIEYFGHRIAYVCERSTVYSKEKRSHCHFTCQKCGKTIHFSVENIDFLKKSVKGKMCHFQIDINGICDDCLHKINSQAG